MKKLSQALKLAKKEDSTIITTIEAFRGFDDLYDFLLEASTNETIVVFAPMGEEK